LAQRVVYRADALYREQREVQFDVAKRRRGWRRRKSAGSNTTTRGGWFLKIKEAHLNLLYRFLYLSLFFCSTRLLSGKRTRDGEGARFGD
jgi:hypothetical protein